MQSHVYRDGFLTKSQHRNVSPQRHCLRLVSHTQPYTDCQAEETWAGPHSSLVAWEVGCGQGREASYIELTVISGHANAPPPHLSLSVLTSVVLTALSCPNNQRPTLLVLDPAKARHGDAPDGGFTAHRGSELNNSLIGVNNGRLQAFL